jgi:RNA recognition motif-containing protein
MMLQVEEISIIFDRNTGVSKGSGLVNMETREQALNAIKALDGQCNMGVSHTISKSIVPELLNISDPIVLRTCLALHQCHGTIPNCRPRKRQ